MYVINSKTSTANVSKTVGAFKFNIAMTLNSTATGEFRFNHLRVSVDVNGDTNQYSHEERDGQQITVRYASSLSSGDKQAIADQMAIIKVNVLANLLDGTELPTE